MTDKNDLYIYQNRIFDVIIIISWILYFFIALRLSVKAPNYLDDLEYYIKIYVSLFLLIRFMPFRKVKFTELDRKIAFNAGIFLFSATTINTIIQSYIKNIQSYVLSNNNFNWLVK
jgi:hypothetical protein